MYAVTSQAFLVSLEVEDKVRETLKPGQQEGGRDPTISMLLHIIKKEFAAPDSVWDLGLGSEESQGEGSRKIVSS